MFETISFGLDIWWTLNILRELLPNAGALDLAPWPAKSPLADILFEVSVCR
jgi:hypothetical protein